MSVITRKECPVHGANYGTPTRSGSFYGKEWCQHCGVPASVLVLVAYVPAEQLRGAVEALARYGRHDHDCGVHAAGACTCGLNAAIDAPSTAGGQSRDSDAPKET